MLKKILFADVANNKGMCYTREGLEKIKSDYEKCKENLGHYFGVFDPEESIPDFVQYGDPDIINIRKIAFTVESMQINKKNELIADIKLMETPSGKALKQLKNNMVFRTSSWGFVSKYGKVVVERLISINAFSKDLDSFKEIDK
jgi:Zn/Cd-binding protein ZinT